MHLDGTYRKHLGGGIRVPGEIKSDGESSRRLDLISLAKTSEQSCFLCIASLRRGAAVTWRHVVERSWFSVVLRQHRQSPQLELSPPRYVMASPHRWLTNVFVHAWKHITNVMKTAAARSPSLEVVPATLAQRTRQRTPTVTHFCIFALFMLLSKLFDE